MSTPALAISRPPILEAIDVIRSKLDELVRDIEIKLADAGPTKRDRLDAILRTHREQNDALRAFLDRHGHESFASAAPLSLTDEGILRIRALFSDLDANILPEIASAQRSLVSYYDDALEVIADADDVLDGGDSLHDLLSAHRRQLEEMIADSNTGASAPRGHSAEYVSA